MKDEKEEARRDLPERTFEFARRVVMLCRALAETPGVNRTLANQLLRSGTSIGANVEEGQASQSRADFVSKYSIACKEARETHYWLRLLVASNILPEPRLADLIRESNELIAILTTIWTFAILHCNSISARFYRRKSLFLVGASTQNWS